jgi:isocitrate dehydrogenase kinase/phosphatase
MYSESVRTLGPRLADVFPLLSGTGRLWDEVEERYLPMIRGRYEADLAFAFIHSVRRAIYHDEWKPVEYAFGDAPADQVSADICRRFPGAARLSAATVREILDIPGYQRPWQDAAEDAHLIAERVNEDFGLDGGGAGAIEAIEMVDAGFYRNRGAYLVGRVDLAGRPSAPLVIALLNDESGIYADAVLTTEADTHNIFSSTLANFNVTNPYYHELAGFLHGIMPNRSPGLHYSTIGFNHVGKVAVINELTAELGAGAEVFGTAVGFPGTVAIAFSAPSSAYVLKVIRDHPTSQYKWGEFAGVEPVRRKYSRVHEINRTGSMLDNIIYYNLELDREWFDPALLEGLARDAGESVSLVGGMVVFKHLIVQARMIPLPVFLESASPADARAAVVNLGHCIKNNAAANVFNKDLDARNYGVGAFLKVYLFDYDALEPFTDVLIRSNEDRIDGEEDLPGWFFEDGVVFLPEEVGMGLRFRDRALGRFFDEAHGDLLSTAYWEAIQRDLRDGKVPGISIYPESRRLKRQVSRLGTYY